MRAMYGFLKTNGPSVLLVVHQHRGVALEEDDLAVGAQADVDAAVVEPRRRGHRQHGALLRLAEDLVRTREEGSFLLLHPALVGHVGAEVVHHPVALSRSTCALGLAITQ